MKTISTKILVTVEDHSDKKNDLGLTLPDPVALQGIEKATVIYVGEEVKTVAKDDNVYIYAGAGTKFTEGEQEYRVITAADIIVIL